MKDQDSNQHPQRLAAAGVLLLVCILLIACEASNVTAEANAPSTGQPMASNRHETAPVPATQMNSSPATESRDEAAKENPNLGDAIRQGMSYTELRNAMERQGWNPVSDESCMINMIGPDHKTFCATHPDSQRCEYCSQLAGLRQCSADGYCLFVFERASDRKRLEVGMQGELENWKFNAPDTMLGVSGWRYPL